jgi:predicted DNA-binding protein with PD1-like motif
MLPGEDLRQGLERWITDHGIEAAAVVSAVGSLQRANLRYAGRTEGQLIVGDLEVCSLSGMLAVHGIHLHLSISDDDGAMLGGHVLDGCIVRTTLEIAVLVIDGVRMFRVDDPMTGYRELDPKAPAS